MKRFIYSFAIIIIFLCFCSKDNDDNPASNQKTKSGVLKGVVAIDFAPYSQCQDPYVMVTSLGTNSLQQQLTYSDFRRVGNKEQASFTLGSFEGGVFSTLSPGIYSIKFEGDFNTTTHGRINLEEKIVSTIGDTPIEVRDNQTTHIGTVTLKPR